MLQFLEKFSLAEVSGRNSSFSVWFITLHCFRSGLVLLVASSLTVLLPSSLFSRPFPYILPFRRAHCLWIHAALLPASLRHGDSRGSRSSSSSSSSAVVGPRKYPTARRLRGDARRRNHSRNRELVPSRSIHFPFRRNPPSFLRAISREEFARLFA